MSDMMNRIKSAVMLLLMLVLLARQWQMQSEMNRLRESQFHFQQDMAQFMETTNSSIESHTAAMEHHTAAIESGTRTMKILARIR